MFLSFSVCRKCGLYLILLAKVDSLEVTQNLYIVMKRILGGYGGIHAFCVPRIWNENGDGLKGWVFQPFESWAAFMHFCVSIVGIWKGCHQFPKSKRISTHVRGLREDWAVFSSTIVFRFDSWFEGWSVVLESADIIDWRWFRHRVMFATLLKEILLFLVDYLCNTVFPWKIPNVLIISLVILSPCSYPLSSLFFSFLLLVFLQYMIAFRFSRKNDLIVWTFLSQAQIERYRCFLGSNNVSKVWSTFCSRWWIWTDGRTLSLCLFFPIQGPSKTDHSSLHARFDTLFDRHCVTLNALSPH